MNEPPRNEDSVPAIAELYPGLSPEQQAEAEKTLTRYTALLVRMVERRAAEREWTAREGNATKGPGGSE